MLLLVRIIKYIHYIPAILLNRDYLGLFWQRDQSNKPLKKGVFIVYYLGK